MVKIAHFLMSGQLEVSSVVSSSSRIDTTIKTSRHSRVLEVGVTYLLINLTMLRDFGEY